MLVLGTSFVNVNCRLALWRQVQQWQQQQRRQQPGAATTALDGTMPATAAAVVPASDSNIARSQRGVVTWLHELAWSSLIQVQNPSLPQGATQDVSCAARVGNTLLPPEHHGAAQHHYNQPHQLKLPASGCLRQRLRKYMLAHAEWRERQEMACSPIAAADTWAVLEHEERVSVEITGPLFPINPACVVICADANDNAHNFQPGLAHVADTLMLSHAMTQNAACIQ